MSQKCKIQLSFRFITCAVQCYAVHCSAWKCSAVQWSALHCMLVHCNAVQCNAVQSSASTALQCSALHCITVQYSVHFCVRPGAVDNAAVCPPNNDPTIPWTLQCTVQCSVSLHCTGSVALTATQWTSPKSSPQKIPQGHQGFVENAVLCTLFPFCKKKIL